MLELQQTACRLLRTSAFTVTTVLTLAMGIGIGRMRALRCE